jgi:hypothetical protein
MRRARRHAAGVGVALLALSLITLPSADAAQARPRITKLSRTSGPYAGGRTVHIYGRNFNHTTSVEFDGRRAMNIHRISRTHLRVWTPQLTAGRHYVRVVTNHGTSKPMRYTAINDGRGAIFGRLTDTTSGKGVTRVVELVGNGARPTASDANGYFRFLGLSPHRYHVCVRNTAPYASMCYPKAILGASSPTRDPGLRPLQVSAGTLLELPFRLTRAGEIRGRVTDYATGRAVAGDWLVARTTDHADHLRYDRQTVSGVDGTFRIPDLAPGHYALCSANGNHMGESPLDDKYVKTCFPYQVWGDYASTPSGSTRFTVPSGAVVTVNPRLRTGARIVGTLTSAVGNRPIAGGSVSFTGPVGIDTATVDATGWFRSPLLGPGSYAVCFSSSNSPTRNALGYGYVDRCQAAPVRLSFGQSVRVSGLLTSYAGIRGVVRDLDGTPLPGIGVRVFGISGEYGAPVISAANGTFQIAAVPGTARLCFEIPSKYPSGPSTTGYYSQCAGGAPWRGPGYDAAAVASASAISTQDSVLITATNTTILQAGAIEGTVTVSDGSAITNGVVHLVDEDRFFVDVPLAAAGSYRVDSLPPGSYLICFAARYGGVTPVRECNADQPWNALPVPSGASPVQVRSGSATRVDAELTAPGG